MSVFKPDIFKGKKVLVTGGGSGICKGIANAFAAHGADVAITSRKQERLDEAAQEMAQHGTQIVPVAADVRKLEEVRRAVDTAVNTLGGLDVLINGAAGNFLAPVAALSENGFRTVVEIDLLGTYNVTKATFEALQKSDFPSITNISATLQYHGTPMQAHAAAAKAGVDSLTRTLAVEWGGLGIRANAIAPGPIDGTEGMSRLAPGDVRQKVIENVPLGRFGRIEEIADMALFLASPAAAYISGAIFVVDGGSCVSPPRLLG